jgi:hypothetical protein
MTFEQLDRSVDADSDSDDELAEQAHMYRSKPTGGTVSLRFPQLTSLSGHPEGKGGRIRVPDLSD